MKELVDFCYKTVISDFKKTPLSGGSVALLFKYKYAIYKNDEDILETCGDYLNYMFAFLGSNKDLKMSLQEGVFGFSLMLNELDKIGGIENSRKYINILNDKFSKAIPSSSSFSLGGGGCIYSLTQTIDDEYKLILKETILKGIDLIYIHNKRFCSRYKVRTLSGFKKRAPIDNEGIYLSHLIEVCKLFTTIQGIKNLYNIRQKDDHSEFYNLLKDSIAGVISSENRNVVSVHFILESCSVLSKVPGNSSLIISCFEFISGGINGVINQGSFNHIIQCYMHCDLLSSKYESAFVQKMILDEIILFISKPNSGMGIGIDGFSGIGLILLDVMQKTDDKSWYKLLAVV